MNSSTSTTAKESLHDWLMSERPQSRRQASFGRAYGAWRTFARNRLAMLGLAIVITLVLVAIFANQLAPYSPYIGDLMTTRLLPPSSAHWFGTDDQGRDILSRIIHGSRVTLYVVALVAVLAAPIGLLVGTVAGYAGGWLDASRRHHLHHACYHGNYGFLLSVFDRLLGTALPVDAADARIAARLRPGQSR